jgi:hypothetical protein
VPAVAFLAEPVEKTRVRKMHRHTGVLQPLCFCGTASCNRLKLNSLQVPSQFHRQKPALFLAPGLETATEDSRAVIQLLGAQKYGYKAIFDFFFCSKTCPRQPF